MKNVYYTGSGVCVHIRNCILKARRDTIENTAKVLARLAVRYENASC